MLGQSFVDIQETQMTNRNGTLGSQEPTPGSGFDQKLDSLKEKAKDMVDQGSEKVEHLRSRVVEAKDKAMARGNAFLDRVTELIKAHPLKAVGIAFGAGYIGMRLFRR
jgi:ElaB/YqjD/DUF883 family membrane-anchored ribosome-binding protein